MLSDGHWRPKHKIEKVKMHLKIQSTQINNRKGARNNDAKNERKKTTMKQKKTIDDVNDALPISYFNEFPFVCSHKNL